MSEVRLRIDRVRVGITNTYLIRGQGAVLIDPGEPGVSRKVLRKLDARTGGLPDIGLILTTHGHFDHVGCGEELRAELGAKLAIHRGDSGWLTEGTLAIPSGLTPWGRCLNAVARTVVPAFVRPKPIEPDWILERDEISLREYGIPGRIIHTPGHTAGSVTLLLTSGEAFVGDAAMNLFPFSVGPSLPCIGDDLDLVRRSWRRLIEMGARTIYPGHGRPFAIEALHEQLRLPETDLVGVGAG